MIMWTWYCFVEPHPPWDRHYFSDATLLLNNLNLLKKAQNELDSHVGKDRNMQESDTIVKETMRLYPARAH